MAAEEGDLARVQRLIEHGADVNGKVLYGETALHRAAGKGHKDIVGLLIAKGGDVNAKMTELGGTPLHEVVDANHVDVAELLIAKGADINAKDDHGRTPLYRAVFYGRKDAKRKSV